MEALTAYQSPGGVVQISSDGDDQNPQKPPGLPAQPKKIPGPKINPKKNPMLNFLALKISRKDHMIYLKGNFSNDKASQYT